MLTSLFPFNLNPQQQEASFALATNDPSGFNAIDTLAWGAIGHALGYFALATNSLIGICPVSSLDGNRIGSAVPGPVTARLQSAYAAEVALRCRPSAR